MEYPEHEKLAAAKAAQGDIGEFLDWCDGEGLQLCEHVSERRDSVTDVPLRGWFPASVSREVLLARFYGVDLAKLDEEKRAMLAALRQEVKP